MNEWLNQETIYLLAMFLPLLLQLAGMLFAVIIDSYIDKRHKKVLLLITCLAFSLVAQNYATYLLETGPLMRLLRTCVSIYGYTVRPVLLVLFLDIVSPGRRMTAAWILVGVNAAVHLSALFSRICFFIGNDNRYHTGPLHNFCLYVSLLLLCYLVYLTILEYGRIRKREMFIPLLNALLIIGAIILDGNVGGDAQPVAFLTDAIVSGSVFFYIWLHLQFVREHEKELKDGQRVQIMLSQIKPHFLYNSLGAIEELCDSDPKKAKEATATFSRYLRGNMGSVSEKPVIPFAQELSHTKCYLELEQIRFEDALHVIIDTPVTDFMIPMLTLEPLVENAVRHGVRGNEDGRGTVTVSTKEYPDRFEVIVTDDGPGFDEAKDSDDGHPHVGLKNVRERLMRVCKGTLTIESAPGQGTRVTICLPKEENG